MLPLIAQLQSDNTPPYRTKKEIQVSPHSAPNRCYCCLSMAPVTGIMGTDKATTPWGPWGWK